MDQIEIAIGTYENLILGYRIQEKVGEEGYTLESSFTTDSHRGALRCLSVSPQGVLASSSTDDSIRLHHLKKRREVGTLFQHDGSVNCIRFFRGHMFSASEDGTICLWKCKNWELLRLLKGHRCHVMAVAVHPSGKLGLSVGNDRTFYTWDLTTGKLAFKRKTEHVVEDLLFTHDGNNYVLVYQKKIEVCSLEDTKVVQDMSFDSRINAVCFVEENILAVGCDDGTVSIVNVLTGTHVLQDSCKGRLRSLCSLSTKTDILLFLATTNGSIRVCRLDVTEGSEKLDTVLDFESGVRVTCMTTYAPTEILKEAKTKHIKDKRRKKKKALEENDEIAEDEDSDINDEDNENKDEEDSEDEIEEEEDNNELSESDGESEDTSNKTPPKKKKKLSSKRVKNEKDDEEDSEEEESDDISDEELEETPVKTPPKKKKKMSAHKVKHPKKSEKRTKKQKKLKADASQK